MWTQAAINDTRKKNTNANRATMANYMIAAATGSDLVPKINAHIECKYDSYFLLHLQINKHVHTLIQLTTSIIIIKITEPSDDDRSSHIATVDAPKNH